MENVIKKLDATYKDASKQFDHYFEQERMAKDDDAREFYSREKNFWLGMANGLQQARAVVVQEEVTGGTPF